MQTSMGYAVINLRNPYMGYADFIIPAGLITIYIYCYSNADITYSKPKFAGLTGRLLICIHTILDLFITLEHKPPKWIHSIYLV